MERIKAATAANKAEADSSPAPAVASNGSDVAEEVRKLRLQKDRLEGLCRALQAQVKMQKMGSEVSCLGESAGDGRGSEVSCLGESAGDGRGSEPESNEHHQNAALTAAGIEAEQVLGDALPLPDRIEQADVHAS
jgi:hypothetical protein